MNKQSLFNTDTSVYKVDKTENSSPSPSKERWKKEV